MSSERIKDHDFSTDKSSHITKQSDKLGTDILNNSSEKDIAVENVIRQLRQKKNIEVKNVNDVYSKFKRITPRHENKTKSGGLGPSKTSTMNSNPQQTSNNSKTVVQQKNSSIEGSSAEPTVFLEIEDDEIEDYLEIDQNVVEDLEALIPEEEIVSISDSLIEPEDDSSIKAIEDPTQSSEKKSGNTDITLYEPNLLSDSNKCENQMTKCIPEETELKLKTDEDMLIDNKFELQLDQLTAEGEIEQNDRTESLTVNNNQSSPKITNDESKFSPNVQPIETSERTLEEDIPRNKKIKINQSKPKKKESQRANKLKQDSKNLRKITDFFTPDRIKIEISEEEEQTPEENFQTVATKTVQLDSSDTVSSEQNEIPYQTRTLRSRSKLSLKTLNEPETKKLQSTHENKAQKNAQERLDKVPLHEPKTNELQPTLEIEASEKLTKVLLDEDKSRKLRSTEEKRPLEENTQDLIGEQSKLSEESNEELAMSALVENNENETKLNSVLSKNMKKDNNNCKRQVKRGNKRGNTRISKGIHQSKEKNNTQEDVEKVIETVVTYTDEAKDIENKPIVSDNQNSTGKEHITTVESEEGPSGNMQITAVEPIQVNETPKKIRKPIPRKKAVAKIQDKLNIETNNAINSVKEINNENNIRLQKSPSDEVEETQSKKGKNQPQKRNRKTRSEKTSESVDTNAVELEQKNQVTKLEIYDFDDDDSNEALELLNQSGKRRKYQTIGKNGAQSRNLNADISKLGKNQTPQASTKRQVESENVNNNSSNISPHTIESYLRSSFGKTSIDLTPAGNKTDHKNEMMDIDLNSATSSGAFPKKSSETGSETGQFGQNWKPTYGPYKRIDRCNVCLLAFKSYKKLRAHKKIHDVENPYKCWECDDSFEDVEKLAAHLRIHQGESFDFML